MEPDTFAFATVLLVNFVDMMGMQFTLPVNVPYGRFMGADLQTIALFATAVGLMRIVSNLWMPRLSDRKGRKCVIIISLLGSAAAYATQGLASNFGKSAVAVFIIGKAVSGFFGGTMPVLRAYVTEISMPDTQLMKQRMTMLVLANQAAGIALMPIAGAMATFGLTLPFFTCAGMGVFGVLWALFFFSEASKVKGQAAGGHQQNQSDNTGRQIEKRIDSVTTDEQKRKNPWCDVVVMCMFFSYASIFILVSCLGLLIPIMLEKESFGLVRATTEETEGNIAKAFGLVMIPNGVMNILVAIFLFIPLTKKVGDLKVVITAGILASVNVATYGFLPTKLWQLCIQQAITGLCFGLVIPALGPFMASYVSVHYPKQMAEANAIPILGMNFSMAFGQNIMAFVHERWGFEAAWIVSSTCVLLFVIFFVLAATLARRREPKSSTLSSKQQKVQLELGGMDVDKFVDFVCEELRQALLTSKANLWNAPVQHLVQKRLAAAVPKIRGWSDETNGLEYLEDLGSLLQESPIELTKFCAMFPHIGDPRSQMNMLGLEAGAAIPFEGIARQTNSNPSLPSSSSVSPRQPMNSIESV
jgi:MFS family permease